ncbi:MAG: hypothetical protein GY913_28360 [Proteobacteria bacterium]|nr:hypothetical protein [Pseudomonadota bacterium]
MDTIEAWIRALTLPSDEHVEAACTADVVVVRYGIFEGRDAIAERIEGRDAVTAWLRRSPEGVTWSASPQDGRWRYRIEIDGFVNHGWWDIVERDGQVAEVHHRADAIDQTPPDRDQVLAEHAARHSKDHSGET